MASFAVISILLEQLLGWQWVRSGARDSTLPHAVIHMGRTPDFDTKFARVHGIPSKTSIGPKQHICDDVGFDGRLSCDEGSPVCETRMHQSRGAVRSVGGNTEQ